MSEKPTPRAFAGDARAYAVGAAVKGVWWSAARAAAGALSRRVKEESRRAPFQPSAEPPPPGFFRRAWLEAFEKDAADVAAGLYPPMDGGAGKPIQTFRQAASVLADARIVEVRRRRGDATEVREEAPATYPAYYRQNFHYQSGGWFTPQSALRYEAQVEALFGGAAGAMRRRALSLLAKAWRERDHRGLKVLDLACGTGAFLGDLAAAFPRARLMGADLSPPYLDTARRAFPGAAFVQAKAEQLPFADASLDAVSAVYLFHELPPKVRQTVAAEIGRVLKPGGLFAFADSIQAGDEPKFARLIEAFPANFHEPFYASYAACDLPALFGEAGLEAAGADQAFLTKALLFEKAG
ncbi:MAG: class I SAM-dependent methyltransferase [Caulobacteraceae bacterium]|nr:class I SAM-dependent methyltransferase [Caulobacteraceae bacterium]